MNKILRTCTFLIFVYFSGNECRGQASDFFNTQGDNISEISCGGILFAPHPNQNFIANNKGAAWLKKPVDLSKPFSTSFTLDLIDNLGVDGGAFVLQADPTAIGESLHGLGFRGIDHSIAVTFDVIQNQTQADPVYDHISIQANGDIDHTTANNLAGPVSMEPFYVTTTYFPHPPVTIFYHLVTINWDPATKIFSVLIDGALVISTVKDIVQDIFGGNPIVYWGFTASNTLQEWRPANSDLDFGHIWFYFGQVFTRFERRPELDSCFGGPIRFIDSSIYSSGNGGDPLAFVKWYWDFGDGTTSTDRNPPPHQYPSAGTYMVKFTITNASGCSFDTLVKKIKLGGNPVPNFTASPLCANSDIQFMDKSTAVMGQAVSWVWEFDNGTASNIQNPVTQFAATGAHNIHLTVHTEFACYADTTITIFINEKPSVDYTFSKDCFGNVRYDASVLNGVVVNKWQWDFGDDRFAQQQSAAHFFSNDGSYATKLWAVTGDCVSDTVEKTVDIRRVRAFAGNDTIAVRSQPVQLHATGGDNFQWSPGNFLDNAGIPDPVAIPPRDQSYILTVTNTDGCVAKDTIAIRVFDHLEIYVPTAFTPNNDGKNDVLHVTAPGIRQLIYFRIYNRWGQTVFETKNPTQGWDGRQRDQLPATGVYVWVIRGVDYLGNSIERKGLVTLIR